MVTPDELRRLVRFAMTEVDGPCPHCHGTGRAKVKAAITQGELAKAIGVNPSQINIFLAGKGGLRMEDTLRLLDWLKEVDGEH